MEWIKYISVHDILCLVGILVYAVFFGIKLYQLGVKPVNEGKEKNK